MRLDRPQTQGCLDDDTVVALLDDVLPADQVLAIHEHLDGCDACRRVVADLARCIRPEDPPSATKLRPGTELGRYLVTRWLGTGSVGVVYEARDTLLQRSVALKVLRPDSAAPDDGRLLREAQALAALSHPNVLAVHDAGMFEGGVFIAMERVEGPTLREWVRAQSRPWAECMGRIVEAARGLAAAHAAGIVHRDFKPDNALITDAGRLVVTDFGLARGGLAEPTDDSSDGPRDLDRPVSNRTEEGVLVGTPAYMAPEQLAGKTATAASDQFAVCVTAYELVVGRLPFGGETIEQRRQAILDRDLALDGGEGGQIPRRMVRVLERGLAADPTARFPSMAAFADAVERELERTRPGPSRWRPIAVTAVLSATVAALAYELIDRDDGPRCGPAELAWGAGERQALGDALPRDTASRVTGVLDGYATAWNTAYSETCIALAESGAERAEQLHLSLACLQSRRREFAAVVDVLGQPDPGSAEHAIRAARELLYVATCRDVEELARTATGDQALDPAMAEKLGDELALATALRDAGRYVSARDAAAALLAELADHPASSLHARTQILLADTQVRLQEADAGHDGYLRALELSKEVGDQHSKARALRGLTFTAALDDQVQQGLEWARLARAAAERSGDDRLISDAHSVTAAVYRAREDREQSLAYSQQALSFWGNADHPNRIIAMYNAGTDLRSLNRFDEAIEMLTRARGDGERILGPQHPIVGTVTASLGTAHAHRGDLEAALPLLREGLRIREAALGPDNPSLSPILLGLANAELNGGHPAVARPLYERCHAIARSPVQRSYCQYGLGKALAKLDEPEASRRALARAYEGADGRITGLILAEIALSYADSLPPTERERAVEVARQAHDLCVEAGEADNPVCMAANRWLDEHP